MRSWPCPNRQQTLSACPGHGHLRAKLLTFLEVAVIRPRPGSVIDLDSILVIGGDDAGRFSQPLVSLSAIAAAIENILEVGAQGLRHTGEVADAAQVAGRRVAIITDQLVGALRADVM